jgi:type I restriction enzyme, S subunit
MTDLPPGWEWARLDEVAEVRLGRQRSPKNHTGNQMRPYLRAANVGWQGLRLDDVKVMNFTDDEADTYRLKYGDVIISEASGSLAEVGKPALWRGEIDECCLQNTLIRARSMGSIDPVYLLHFLRAEALRGAFAERSRGVGIHHLGATRLAGWPIPIPPLAEQHRIITTLDAYLSGWNVGLSDISRAQRHIAELWQSTLDRGVFGRSHGRNWPASSLDQLSHGGDYGTSVKCSYDGQGVAVVRIPNIRDGVVDLTDMKYAAGQVADFPRLRLALGDILFVRTNGSRSLIGRTAVVDETGASLAFASYLIRFRLRTEIVRPRWVHHVLQSSACRRRLEREAASSAGQYNLSLAKLGSIQIPVPRLSEQDSILAELNNLRSAIDRLRASLGVAESRSEALRRSLLVDAFSGRLVPQVPNDEPASVLLERIKAERAAQPKPTRGWHSSTRTNPDQESML